MRRSISLAVDLAGAIALAGIDSTLEPCPVQDTILVASASHDHAKEQVRPSVVRDHVLKGLGPGIDASPLNR